MSAIKVHEEFSKIYPITGVRFEFLPKLWFGGRKTAQAYIMVHGNAQSPAAFSKMGDFLSERSNAMSVLLHGHGSTPEDLRLASLELSRKRLRSALCFARKHLGKRIVFIGHSVGAVLATELAVHETETGADDVEIVLITPGFFWPDQVMRTVRKNTIRTVDRFGPLENQPLKSFLVDPLYSGRCGLLTEYGYGRIAQKSAQNCADALALARDLIRRKPEVIAKIRKRVILLENDIFCDPGLIERNLEELKLKPGDVSVIPAAMRLDHYTLLQDRRVFRDLIFH